MRRQLREDPYITYVLETTTIGRKTLVQWNGVTLVVLPVGDTRRDHPLLLLLRGSLSWRTPEDGWGRAGRTAGDLLVLEARRLQRILHNVRHLDNPLLQCVGVTLLTGSVPNESRLPLAVRDVLGLGRLDLAIHQLLQSSASLVRGGLDLILRRTVQRALGLIEIFTMGERHKVLELRLHDLARTLALKGDGVVADISLSVDLQSQCVAGGSLGRLSVTMESPILFSSPSFCPCSEDTEQHDIQGTIHRPLQRTKWLEAAYW